ncbi:MAG: sialidase family protein [Bacteroidales bacterium]
MSFTFRNFIFTSAFSGLFFGVQAKTTPHVVAKPPSDAYIGLSKMPDGEIRHYNYGEQAEPGCFYLSSKDNGMSWTKISYPDTIHYADVCNPQTRTMLRLFNHGDGVWCIRYPENQNGTSDVFKISDNALIMLKPPVFIRGGKRALVCTHYAGPDKAANNGARVLISDDDGLTWRESEKVNVPPHKKEAFHQGIRWNHDAVEPTVIELADGRILMVMRTAQDRHYQSYSYDGGETWTTPVPSSFYGTITMPAFTRLKDGRLLFTWNNTTPLPELPTANGVWDDVFTNRNALHAAISEDDGKTWIGCRELYLDERRNAADFGETPGMDKSVHQSQAIETDNGMIVMAIGQHDLHRKIIRFDPEWLYEKDRTSDFSNGTDDWSTFQYYKGIKGHCGYNRKAGGRFVYPQSLNGKRALNLHHVPNDSLVYSGEGAVWNFPAMMKGEFTTSIRIPKNSRGGKLLLSDRWFNPSDTTATWFCSYSLELNNRLKGLEDDRFHSLRIVWDLTKSKSEADVFIGNDKTPVCSIPLRNEVTHGISYVHFMASEYPDPIGIDIARVHAESIR